MTTINHISKKFVLALGVAMGVLIIFSSSVFAESDKKKEKFTNKEIIELENLIQSQFEEDEIFSEIVSINESTVKIFNTQNELIYEAAIRKIEDVKDDKLSKLMLQSDFIMEHNNTSYYRLHN
ncbi:hypothetical protein QQ008_06260 [Fulvivirgaceae bacterium BMA10]|uniref:Uncharacterized protein n=1 Tax=Splendidivirga corallicola TaxID=3051826 RepID=A0ABT8KJR3_9BACT|nr:hypothetical protein [Fulvivirgaceae bacterium BMA10]